MEVMVAAAVLALGAVLVYQAFFISLDSFDYYAQYLAVSGWMNEMTWRAQDSVSRLGSPSSLGNGGEFNAANGKLFRWALSSEKLDAMSGLFQIELELSWQEGKRDNRLARTAYALYGKP